MYNCPVCKNEIVKSYPNDKFKLRTNIVVWENGKAICKCQQCHSDVPIPLKLELPVGKKLKHYILDNEVKNAVVDKRVKKT